MHEREIEEFLRQCESESFEKGEIVFKKGETGDKFYLIVSGDVLILPGKGEIRLEHGNVFGEMAILDQTVRTATAMAATNVTLFSMHRDIFSTDMVGLRCKIAIGIAKQLSDKLRNANQILNQVSEQLNKAMKGIEENS
jgi:CRP-like cAMP-binding protein